LAALLVGLALLLGINTAFARGAEAQTGGHDNSAVAVNTKDGSSLFRFAFNITRVTGSVVDPTNAAVAYASCTECRTVAVAIQIVLVEGSPTVFTPENVAVAINDGCNTCQTLASAYQFVFQSTGGNLELTPQGQKELREVLKAIRKLRDSGLSAAELQAQLDVQAQKLYDVFNTQLHLVPEPGAPGAGATTTTSGASTPVAGGAGPTSTGGPTTSIRQATSSTSPNAAGSSTSVGSAPSSSSPTTGTSPTTAAAAPPATPTT